MKKKCSIKDIAHRSGVSIGTVDRVIHNRGRVSKESIKKVNQVLKEMDYTPNPMARSLRNNTVYKINVLIPDPRMDPYWMPCEMGIMEVVKEFRAFNVEVTIKKYDPSKPRSFSLLGNRLMGNDPDALLLVPFFDRESERLLDNLGKRGIFAATFNSPPRKKVGGHVGQDLFLSGRVAAQLVRKSISSSSEIGIIHIDESINNSTHMQEKENGFKMFFRDQEENRHIRVFTLKGRELTDRLWALAKEHPKMDAFFVTTSKTYKVASAIKTLGLDTKIVGYDLLPQNIDHLTNGTIEYLIHQAPKHQAYLSLKGIIEKLLFDKELPEEQLLPIEIVSSENLRSYT